MPRHKKKFVDKNAPNAFTFRLVHRSQRDPRAADPDAAPYLLQPVDQGAAAAGLELDPDFLFGSAGGETATRSERKGAAEAAAEGDEEALLKFGIYYKDEYDYMQHLRERGGANTDFVAADSDAVAQLAAGQRAARLERLGLPAELFPSALEEDVGLLNRAAPNSDPRLDWDPDVVRRRVGGGEA